MPMSQTIRGEVHVLPVLFVPLRPTDSSTQLFDGQKSGNAHSGVTLACPDTNTWTGQLTRSRVRTISKESGCMAAAISIDRRAIKPVEVGVERTGSGE
jgi:hypothetical protein